MPAMSLNRLVLVLSAATGLLAGGACATGAGVDAGSGASSAGGSISNGGEGGSSQGGAGGETACGTMCDQDGDGVFDDDDACPDTPMGEPVNNVGCAASQLEPTLVERWPPYGLTWTSSGDLGRPGGLTWTYTDIDRADLFHIFWILCDSPATPCGLSLDGPIDVMTEGWQFSAANSDLPGGTVVFLNATNIALADNSNPAVTGRLTVTIVDENGTAMPFADLASLGVSGADGKYGAEILGAGFTVTAIVEVQDAATWTPYLDYFDAAATPDPGPGTAVSFGGSFYDM
jgi:hypothetical protein